MELFDGFTPQLGDTFRFLLAANVTGVFADTVFPNLGDLTLEVVYGADFAELGVNAIPIPPALWLFTSALALLIARRRV